MPKLTRFLIAIAVMTLAISVLWSYRVQADYEAPLFAPSATRPVALPAATQIEVVIANGISSSAREGTPVTAFVSTPVSLNGRMVIPPGAKLEGKLGNPSVSRSTIKASVTFTQLTLSGRSHSIQTRPTRVVAPVRKDIKTLLNALNTIVAAGIGAGLGSSSRDPRLIEDGLIYGARSSLTTKSAVHISVILSRDVEI